MAILWKSVFMVTVIFIFRRRFLRKRSLHDGLYGFLKHIGSLKRLGKLYTLQKSFHTGFEISTLDLPEA